jgi:inhibitor of cysteine peptidase
MLHIDESFLDQTVRLPIGQVIELRLKENPTTGFRWSFAADGKPACAVILDSFKRRHTGPPGAGGDHAWRIKAVRAGICHLELLYRRPYEPDAPPARTFAFDVQVTE